MTLETPLEGPARGILFAGRYEIIEELGTGGMGRVYRAYDKKIEEEVALKLIRPDIAAERRTVERFRNEIKTARKIRHANVCGMHDLHEEGKTLFITMEYVRGEDLKSLMRRTKVLAAGTAVSIARQVAEGLGEAHRLGVVHRDLKPSNIMIDKEGNAKIMDFGIARSLTGAGTTTEGAIIGTPEYMSPEQVEGREADQQSDIYSLGVILYEMVTGRIPFLGDTALVIAVKHKTEQPQDPRGINPQVSEELSCAILRCLEKDKNKRPQSAGELLSDLESLEKGMPTTERAVHEKRPRASREISVTVGLRKALVPVLVFIGIIVIGVITWRLLPKREIVTASLIENSVAVISFKNQTGDKAYDYLQEAVPNLLITNLENTGYLHVATWERMRDLLTQSGRENEKLIDESTGFELCRREGIASIVLGSIIKAGETFATDVKVLDVRSKTLLKSASSRGEGVDSIINKQIDELSREITRGVGVSRKKVEAAQIKVSERATSSMEAYEYFLRGSDAYNNSYWDDARKFFEKAIELDPTFAMAYAYLSSAYNNLREYAARDEAIKKAKMYAEKASERERLWIEVMYALRIEKDGEKRIRILEEIVEKYPKEKRAYYALAGHYRYADVRKSIELYNKALDLDPDNGVVWNQLGYIYSDMGDFQKAIEYFQKYASLSPWDASPVDSIAELHYRMGRLELAIAKYKEALAIKPDFGSGPKIAYICALREDYGEALRWIGQFTAQAPSPGLKSEGGWWEAFYLFWLGKIDQSLGRLQRVFDDLGVSEAYSRMAVDILRGWIHYDSGDLELSQEFFKKVRDFFKDYPPSVISGYTANYNFRLGLIALKQSRVDSARSRLKELESLLPMSPWKDEAAFHIANLKAEILLAEGKPQEAAVVCEQANPRNIPAMNAESIVTYNAPCMRDTLARAYVQMGDLDRAISEYERMLTFDPASQERRLIHPRLHYRLAKLYEEKARKEKAIDQYQRFLDIWNDADPGQTEIEDARKRLARLQQ